MSVMTEKVNSEKKPRGRRPAVSIAERIAETEKLLASLREQQRREERENVEKNRKAILDLFKAERLDLIPVDEWKKVVPQLRALVGAGSTGGSPATGADSARTGQQEQAKAA